MHNYKLERLKI